MFHQTMFSYLKHCIQQSRGHISLTKAVVLSASTRNFFATIAMHCNNMPLQVKNTTIVYVFCLHSHNVTDLSGNTCFLQQVLKRSLWCNRFRCPISLSGRAVLPCAPCTCTSSIKAVVFSPVSPLNNITVTSLTRL